MVDNVTTNIKKSIIKHIDNRGNYDFVPPKPRITYCFL